MPPLHAVLCLCLERERLPARETGLVLRFPDLGQGLEWGWVVVGV